MEINIKKIKLATIKLPLITLLIMLSTSFLFGGFASAVVAEPVGAGATTPTTAGTGASNAPDCTQAAADSNALSSCCAGSGQTVYAGCPDNQSDPAANCNDNAGEISQCNLIAKYINPTIELLSGIFGLAAVISIIMGGINFATSEGDPQKVSKAKDRILNTVLAIIAYLFLFSFLQFLVPGGLFR